MAQTNPRCPKCQKAMERGHIPDLGDGPVYATVWSPGATERRRFIGGIKVNTGSQLPLSAFRCPGCGYVELYAPPA